MSDSPFATAIIIPQHFHFGSIIVAGVQVPTLGIPMPDGTTTVIIYSDAENLAQCLIENERRCKGEAAGTLPASTQSYN